MQLQKAVFFMEDFQDTWISIITIRSFGSSCFSEAREHSHRNAMNKLFYFSSSREWLPWCNGPEDVVVGFSAVVVYFPFPYPLSLNVSCIWSRLVHPGYGFGSCWNGSFNLSRHCKQHEPTLNYNIEPSITRPPAWMMLVRESVHRERQEATCQGSVNVTSLIRD